MNATHPAIRSEAAPTAPRHFRFLRNPVVLERGLGVLLWAGLIVVLVAKPF